MMGSYIWPPTDSPLSELQAKGPHVGDNYPQCQQDQDTEIPLPEITAAAPGAIVATS